MQYSPMDATMNYMQFIFQKNQRNNNLMMKNDYAMPTTEFKPFYG